jgi:hypothetical protein
MVKHGPMTRIDQYAFRAVNKVTVAIVGGHGLPDECVDIVYYFHFKSSANRDVHPETVVFPPPPLNPLPPGEGKWIFSMGTD